MRKLKEPNHDAFERFPLLSDELITELRKVFPVKEIHPLSNPTEIYYNAGVQKVIDFLIDVSAKQKEQRNVHISEHA